MDIAIIQNIQHFIKTIHSSLLLIFLTFYFNIKPSTTKEKIIMNNAYIRVSSDKSTVENQRFEIMNYCNQHNIVVTGDHATHVTRTRILH